MAEFEVTFRRQVIETDEWKETIEADTREEAEAKAEARASEMDMSCPDGVETLGGAHIGGWGVEGVQTAEEAAAEAVAA